MRICTAASVGARPSAEDSVVAADSALQEIIVRVLPEAASLIGTGTAKRLGVLQSKI